MGIFARIGLGMFIIFIGSGAISTWFNSTMMWVFVIFGLALLGYWVIDAIRRR